ncbi:hypothetical protein NECID01_1334 [Nematocida sp. AWRm77]|nr:hypothetical protein NECID01_1334 [Nematocida sp. AWRm77]
MQLGLSLEALKEKKAAKESKRKQLQKERKEKNKEDTDRGEEKENILQEERVRPSTKKFSREERNFLLDQACANTPGEITGLTEEEKKGLLKVTVNILNTIPYEPVKIIHFPPDRDPHRKPNAKSKHKEKQRGDDNSSGRQRRGDDNSSGRQRRGDDNSSGRQRGRPERKNFKRE